jgi:sugar lactone lactonase YvrE
MTLPTAVAITDVVLGGLAFPEGPRWHDGRLWFSDMHADEVVAVTPSGVRETIAHVENQPSGLGFLPDGGLLVVSMTDRRVLRQEPDGNLVEHADLSGFASFHCNDMVVDASGRAYVGNFGFDLHGGSAPCSTDLHLVSAAGSVKVAATDMAFPNGTVITPDGKTLIVGETQAGRLTAFDIDADGSLSNRRVWAAIPDRSLPDGICLDAEGAIWSACPRTGRVFRMAEGGEVLAVVQVDAGQNAYACMLGGEDRRTLYVCASAASARGECQVNRTARIMALNIDVPGAGLP